MGKLIFKSLILFAFLFSLLTTSGQDLLKSRDLGSYKVDLLSDADILKIRQQLNAQNVNIEQVRPLLINRGMTVSEYNKLRIRLQSTSYTKQSTTGKYKVDENQAQLRLQKDQKQILSKDQALFEILENDSLEAINLKRSTRPIIDNRIFGSELFNSNDLFGPKFEADIYNIATPLNYELGPGDLIQLVVYGQQEFQDNLEVSREGYVNIENVGLVKVGGLFIEAAISKIKQSMMRAYPTLSSGSSKVSLTLAETRTIHITVIGANKSGTLNIPSLYNVYGALSMAGGPTNLGSFRMIELVRNNKVIKLIDLYKLIAKGDQTDNVGLRDNDIIRIPAYKNRIELLGQVKRPGLYEVLPQETFSDILSFAGGFDDTAYTASVKVMRRGDREREIKDLLSANYNSFKPNSGDQFVIGKILNRYANRVKINGSVYRPDSYEFLPGMRISDLVSKADGLSEDAFQERALLIRQRIDLTKEMKSINLYKALQNDPAHNLELKREDELLVSSIVDLRDSLKVTLHGEVHVPGEYNFIEGMTLKSLILQAGGFTDAYSPNIEVAHLIVRNAIESNDTRSSIIENIKLIDTLSFSQLDVPLKPYDVITIRKKPAYHKLETVLAVGQVQFAGPYALENANERVSDLYKRIGGVLPDANINGAYLKRFKSDEEKKRIAEDARRLQAQISDSTSSILRDVEKDYDKIPLNMYEILKNPGSAADVILKSRDELIIPKVDAQVRISGSVLQSTQIPFENGKRFKSYISSAGGFSKDAWKHSAYIVYANGRATTTKRFLFFRNYPKVLPGAEIIVPKEPVAKNRVSPAEFIGISSAIASLAGVVIALLRL